MRQRHPLEVRIAALRGRARRQLAQHGVAWLLLGLVAAIAAATLLDWLIHLVPELRLALLFGVVGVGAWLLIRRVIAPLVVRFDDLALAMKIEERWPGLNDRLASTIQFLRRPDDPNAGSRSLRDATIAQTIAETDAIDFRAAIDRRPARRAVAWASLATGLAALVLILAPISSRVALTRLFRPFGTTEWPRLTHLRIVEAETPRKVARGEPFGLAVAVGPGERMPSSARVTYTFSDGETTVEPLRPADDGIFRGRLDAASRPFAFVVTAGDDETLPWAVAVVPPPVLAELKVKVVPPAYTGLPPLEVVEGNTAIKAVFGSRIELEGRANKPLATAILKRGDGATPVADAPATLGDGGLAVAARFPVEASGPFWFELKDTEGFKGQEVVRYDLRSLADEAPRVAIEEPGQDRDVPAGATISVRIAAEDDFGLQSLRLVYKTASGGSEPGREVIVPLFDGQAARERAEGKRPSRKEVATYAFDLAPLGLQAGSVITLIADARDFDDLKGPNLGKSRELRLRIVSDDEARRQLEDQERALRDDIERTLAMQKQAQAPVADAARTLARTGALPDPARNNLRDAEAIQRQVSGKVVGKADGLSQKVDRILKDLDGFKVAPPDARRQMLALRESLDRIAGKNLTPAEQDLARAARALDNDRPDAPAEGSQPNPPDDGSKPNSGDQTNPNRAGSPKPDAPNPGPDGQPTPKADPAGDGAKPTPGGSKPAPGTNPIPPGGDPAKPPGGAKPGAESKADPAKPVAGTNPISGKSDEAKSAANSGESKGSGKPGESGAPKPNAGSKPNAGGKPEGGKPPTDAEGALADAAKEQKAIADELKSMLDGMSEFDTVRGMIKDAKALLQGQEQAMKGAADAAAKPDLAGKPADALTPAQKSDLENLGAKQAELAKGQADLESKLDAMAKKIEGSDPLAAAALREAAQASRSKATAAKMSEAAEQLGKNQMARGQANQESARDDLKAMVDALQNRRERELARLVQELKGAEAELKSLKDRQAANLKKTADAKKMADPKAREAELQKLAKEQAEIQKELKRQLQKLAKLGAEGAAKAGDKAAGEMAKAEGDLNEDKAEDAEGEMEEALDNLREAQREVAQNRREAEENLAMEQISKMADALKSIAERQKKMVDETAKYEAARGANAGKLSIAQRTGVRDLGRVQDGLKDEADELAGRLGEGAPVFTLTLKRASSSMESASSRLIALKTDEPTTAAEKSASTRLQALIDSLKPDTPKKKDGDGGGGGGGGGAGGPKGDGIPAAAQMKMLKTLQQEINERTDSFDELARREIKLTPDQQADLARLHDDQGALADLVRDLTRPKQPDGED